MAQATRVLGHLIGVDFQRKSLHRGIKDDAEADTSRGFHAAAQMFRRMSAMDGSAAPGRWRLNRGARCNPRGQRTW